jgi:endonuclease/exonuclease/phosphatase family metal-dependent hydrolase
MRAFPRITGVAILFAALIGAAQAEPSEITVVSYNIENYLVMQRKGELAPKPEADKDAVVKIIASLKPDILGVCEMGDKEQFADFQKRLADAGLKFTDTEYVTGEGQDNVRHVALLSKFPIVSRQPVTDPGYQLNGHELKIQRGFLDVTIQVTKDFQLRCIGAHLKSKRPVPDGEALMRRNESHLLREHVSAILTKDPKANVLLFGDYNDTRNEAAIQEVMGPRGSVAHLTDIPVADSLGDRWTEYWDTAGIYSRIDYFFASRALLPHIDQAKSFIDRSPNWSAASDHRAIVTKIRVGK